jgi:hypothetical protein
MHSPSIVLTVCEQHQVSPADFFGKGRTKKLSEARRAAIEALADAGFGTHATARLVKRDTSTVIYWLKQSARDRRRNYIRNYSANARSEVERIEHINCLQGTLRACMKELREIDPGLLAQVLS